MSCLVLSCPEGPRCAARRRSYCPVLSCPVMSCPVLSCPDQHRIVMSRNKTFRIVQVLARDVPYCHVLSGQASRSRAGAAAWEQRLVFFTTPASPSSRSAVPSVGVGSAPSTDKRRRVRTKRTGAIASVRATLKLALAEREKELRLERARSDSLAAEHATLVYELKRANEERDEARRSFNARLQAAHNRSAVTLAESLQQRDDRHALALRTVRDQASLEANLLRTQLEKYKEDAARIRRERDRARADASRYYRERLLARKEASELRVDRSSAAVQQALRPEFPGSPGRE